MHLKKHSLARRRTDRSSSSGWGQQLSSVPAITTVPLGDGFHLKKRKKEKKKIVPDSSSSKYSEKLPGPETGITRYIAEYCIQLQFIVVFPLQAPNLLPAPHSEKPVW